MQRLYNTGFGSEYGLIKSARKNGAPARHSPPKSLQRAAVQLHLPLSFAADAGRRFFFQRHVKWARYSDADRRSGSKS